MTGAPATRSRWAGVVGSAFATRSAGPEARSVGSVTVSDPGPSARPPEQSPTPSTPPPAHSQLSSEPNVDARPDGPELSIDVRAFLPEGTEVGDETGSPAAADGSEVGRDPQAGGAEGSDPAADGNQVDLAVLTRIEGDLAAVDTALAALDQGTYGRCTTCGTEIDPATLAEDPVALTCPQHSQV